MATSLFSTVEVNPGPIQEDSGRVPVESRSRNATPAKWRSVSGTVRSTGPARGPTSATRIFWGAPNSSGREGP